MTNEDIIRMAREAGLQAIYSACDEPNIRYAYENWDDELEHFANLITKHILAKSYPELVSLAAKHAAETVAAAEREACARTAMELLFVYIGSYPINEQFADAIRARGQG
jgi:hypothetical protein